MAKLTRKKIKELIKDEAKGSKEYRKYGLLKLAKEESRHRKFLIKLKKKIKK